VAHAWAGRKEALADWALARLVNRFDCWGSYNPLEEIGRKYSKEDGSEGEIGAQTARPWMYQRGKVFLSCYHLRNHFAGLRREHIVGLHSTSPENVSRWGGLDIDHHGPKSTSAEVNWAAALAWYDVLVRRGFEPLLTDSNGTGSGFHLLTIFAEPVPTPRVFHFLKGLVADHADRGMTKPPECFPKQPMIQPGRFGNWLRLPGRHHTRDHWSRTWSGDGWLDGAEAIKFILSLTGDPVDLVPEPPPPEPPRRTSAPRVMPGDRLAFRIARYMSRLPNLGAGQGRDDVAFGFACWLARDIALGDEDSLRWLELWDSGNRPPKGRKALAEILDNAKRYGKNEVGSGLGDRHGHAYTVLHAETEVLL
jgi:hypothetical protein